MEMQSAIARHPFFGQMKPNLLGIVCAQAQEMRFSPGQTIFRQGEPANRFYIILDGQVALECHAPPHGDILIQRFGGGEVLGWSWLLAPFAWEFQARAVEATEIIALDGGHLLVMCEQNHELGFELLKRMSKLIVATLQAIRRQLLTTGPMAAADGPAGSGGAVLGPGRVIAGTHGGASFLARITAGNTWPR